MSDLVPVHSDEVLHRRAILLPLVPFLTSTGAAELPVVGYLMLIVLPAEIATETCFFGRCVYDRLAPHGPYDYLERDGIKRNTSLGNRTTIA